MREDIAGPEGASSRPMWEVLERMVREKAQEFIQQIMEEEVTELLGREKSERRKAADGPEGYRNGYGKPRRLAMSSGTITLRRPRVRGVEERFESRVLPLFARRTKEVGALLPELYLHGLAEGDFELAMRGLLGEGAPLSKSSIRRLRAGWAAEFEGWSKRSLADREVVYVWADGIYVKAGLERDKAALLVVLGAMRDGTKEVLAVRSGYRESVESWSEVLRELKARGIEAPKLLMADGNAAIWGAVRQVWPEAGGATVLEPQDAQCPGPAAEARAAGRQGAAEGGGLCSDAGRGHEGPSGVREALRVVVSESGGRAPRTTGSGWSASTTFPRPTGSICARPTWSRARLLRYGFAPRQRNDSSGSRALRP